jgi:hypothetical protein
MTPGNPSQIDRNWGILKDVEGETRELANLFAKMFIQRKDVKAVQKPDGTWKPDRTPWTRADLEAHIRGERTFGHYLLDQDSKCKLFVLDVDLEKKGVWAPDLPEVDAWDIEADKYEGSFVELDPLNPDGIGLREAWLDRKHPARKWMKFQFRTLIHALTKTIKTELGIPCAAAYSGGKGVHVYGFTGSYSAAEVREGGLLILDSLGGWVPSRGNNFFKSTDRDPITGYPNLSIELYPKQDSLADKDLGNLVRLPLGRNQKSKDPTFFIDPTAEIGELKPMNPVNALLGWGE